MKKVSKYTFLLFFACIVVQAQQKLPLPIEPINMHYYGFNIHSIVDSTQNKYIGHHYDSDSIEIKHGFQNRFTNLFQNSPNQSKHFNLVITQLNIQETRTNQFYVASINLSYKLYDINGQLIKQHTNAINTAITKKPKKTRCRHYGYIIKKLFENSFEKPKSFTTKKVKRKNTLIDSSIVYFKSFSDYLQDLKEYRPKTEFYKENFTQTDGNDKIIASQSFIGFSSYNYSKNLWGVQKNDTLYINILDVFHQVHKNPDGSLHTLSPTNFFISKSKNGTTITSAIIGGILAGPIGAAVLTAITSPTSTYNHELNLIKYKIDDKNGSLRFNYINDRLAKPGIYLMGSTKNTQYSYDITVNGIPQNLINEQVLFIESTNNTTEICYNGKCKTVKPSKQQFSSYIMTFTKKGKIHLITATPEQIKLAINCYHQQLK